MPEIALSGLTTGFDWRSLVDQLTEVERTPQTRLRSEQNTIQQRNNAYTAIATQLGVLQNRVKDLKDASVFSARGATSSDTDRATVSASAGAALGNYAIHVSRRATTAARVGESNVSNGLSATGDMSGLTLADAPLATAITAGVFTVNGRRVTVETTDTFEDVFVKINSATNGTVTPSYDPDTDRITLNGTGTIVLGSATDTSNFLQATHLRNNGTNSVSSAATLGSVKLSAALNSANLSQPINDGGGSGRFSINGVEIAFRTSDTVQDVLNRINASEAGVTASYDRVNDRFRLTNKTTGDVGIGMQEISGNFLSSVGLMSGSLERGNNLRYTVNGGPELISQSNTITDESSNIDGLSVTVLEEGDVTVAVNTDGDRIRTAISNFIEEYNRTQALIDTHTASATDAQGRVTAGVLAGESDAFDLASRLRSIATSAVSGLGGNLSRLESIGITTNGTDNALALSDGSRLDDAIANHLNDLTNLFTKETTGIVSQLSGLLDRTIGEDGSLVEHQDTLKQQIAGIDTQVADQERFVQSQRQRLIASFISMETAQARINQQLQFLQQRFGKAS